MSAPAGKPDSSQRARTQAGADAATALPPVCILAGGLGTRLGARVRDTPKPLLEVAGEPFLVHQLRLLARHGAREAVLCVGYLGELIESRIGAARFGIDIRYSFDAPGLEGTLGAVRRALPLLGERFLVVNGDTYLPADYAAAARAWRESALPALMCVLHNEDRHEPSNAQYADGRVLSYEKPAVRDGLAWIDAGLGGFERELLERTVPCERELSGLYAHLADVGLLCGFEASERYYEIGTLAALAETDRFLSAAV
ncbi:MAG TPA: NTP transferase domain-containing protein [Solirubrobacteraceae bacterium]|nr:NTP transferase domain-containing protein [Solirubrobacteraceae bacterium]